MNHTLLSHRSYPLDYPLSSENDYLLGERPFSTSSHFSTGDFFQSGPKNGLAGHSSQSLAIPINPAFRHNSIQDVSTSSLLLSPPDSLSGSLPAVTSASSSANQYSTSNLPRFFPGNVSSADSYSNAPASCLPEVLYGPSMSNFNERARAPAQYNSFPPGSPPPMTYLGSGPPPFAGYSRGHLPPLYNHHNLSHIQHTANPNGYEKQSTPRTISANEFGPWTQTSMPIETRSERQNTPPFEDTKVLRTIVTPRGNHISPDIQASIPKGFFEVDGKWTCYRRNYFPVVCSFTVKPQGPDGTYYLQRDGQQVAPISHFAVAISAKTAVVNNQDSQARGLVQHTPKRDKATESTPGKVIIQPIAQMSSNGLASSMHTYSSPQHVAPNMILNYQPYSASQEQSPPTQYTFERIQFQKATANNGKRRAQQQFFHIVVELWADVGRPGKPEWVEIAMKQSAQMVVRGRSPGHYKDTGRRDSTTSMDPDRGAGTGGDVSGAMHGPLSMLGGNHHGNGMDWSSTGKANHHYSGRQYHQPSGIASPDSASTSGTLTGSPTELDASFKSEQAASSPDAASCNPPQAYHHAESAFASGRLSLSSNLKRPYEEDCAFMTSFFENRRRLHIDAFLPSHLDCLPSQQLSVS